MRARGFTMMEFILVVAISSILFLGMGVVVEMPRQMVERQQDEAPPSSALVPINQLETDIRFAANVVVPDSKRLQIFPKSGPMIEYAWDGVIGGVLTRTDSQGSVTLLQNVRVLSFGAETATIPGEPRENDVTSVDLPAASWDTFSLNPGFFFGLVGLRAVSVISSTIQVKNGSRVGLVFHPTGFGGDTALPTAVTLRMSRLGMAVLHVAIFPADPVTFAPDRTNPPIASARVRHPSLPVAMTDFTIPLTATGRLTEGEPYVVLLRSGNDALSSCIVEHHALSLPLAAAAATTSVIVNDGPNWQIVPGLSLDSSQSPFTVHATVDQVVPGSGGPTSITIPISVSIFIALVDKTGTNLLRTSFPVENNMLLVNQ